MNQQFVIDPSEVPWKSLSLEHGARADLQMYLRGTDGGPEAVRARMTEGCEVEPHFHLAAQFQLLLAGSMQFPTFRLDAPAVHYTEHNVPYGPFVTSNAHDMLVLHTRPGGVVMMRDRARRYEANTRGRELTRCAHEVEWESLPGYEGARRKVLIPASAGPSVELIECPPHMEYQTSAPTYGRYEVVHAGMVFVDGKKLGPRGLRFIAAGEDAVPLRCGPEGATIIVLTFDRDAAQGYGGSTEEIIARMEQ